MPETYVPIIGIEVHAELKTKTKMFSRSLNNPDETKPNSIIDPVNMAHPGTLPVINKRAVEHMVRIGLAVDGEIANFTEFDRKNYFYPDIPKGYQISQYKYPIVSGGMLGGVKLTRIHLEEDTGTSKHFDEDGGYSLIDYNRAGVPLMELVTEPVIYTAEDAGKFGKELQLLLRYLGAGDANMEKGEMRVEVNISVLKTDKTPEELYDMYLNDNDAYMAMLGTKVEVKNINSFSAAEKAAAYELDRMVKLIEEGRGDEIVQETRGWDDPSGSTKSQRAKESAHDYRYFPDPDLPKLYLHELFDLDKEKAGLPELPWQKRERYSSDYGISDEAIEMFVKDKSLAEYFETIADTLGDKKLITSASNYITSDFVGLQKENPEAKLPEADAFITLMQMIGAGDLNSRGAKDLLAILVTDGGNPKQIAEEKGLIQKNDPEALKKMAQEVIDANPDAVQQYKDGNENIIKFLMGNVMKASKGSANPQMAEEALKELMK
jgi:aspartyl-tRNA(Asn)/glutamyl-tRNA(Gln) amidotransferase subunit B